MVLEFEKPILDLENKIAEMKALSGDLDLTEEISKLESKVDSLRESVYMSLTRWQRVQLARHPERPYTLDYCSLMLDEFVELHGDRGFRDDPAIVGGLGSLAGKPVVLIGHQKGRDARSNVYRNFGMPNPEGYRKAARLMRMAERFGRPVICLLDTPGAFPGIEAEERGQAEAIAANLALMARLKVPVVIAIIGEGASGGALGIGVGDRLLMLENAWYSVIAPESCSSILWRSWEYKEQAAESLKLTAPDLLEIGVIDRIVKEPVGGAHRDHIGMANVLKDVIVEELAALECLSTDDLLSQRLAKLSAMGAWREV